MIAQLTGDLVELTASHAVLDVMGVGYELGISTLTASSLPGIGAHGVTLLTRLVVREDAMLLYGFATREERTMFDKLTNISRVGPKLALSVLSTFTPADLVAVVFANDESQLTRVPGVGKKAAKTLLVELESVFAKDPTLASLASSSAFAASSAPVAPASSGFSTAEADAQAALLAMGFSPDEASLALDGFEDAGATDAKSALSYALKRLGRRA